MNPYFALVGTDGSLTEVSASSSGDDLRVLVGDWLEGIDAKDGSELSGYVDEEATLKEGIPHNRLASILLGVVVLGPAVLTGGCGSDGDDLGLSHPQWRHVREVAASLTA